MCGEKLSINLVNHFRSLSSITIPVFEYDQNNEKTLPCVVVGYDQETLSFPGGHGHFTVSGFTLISYNGYEDRQNTLANQIAETISYELIKKSTLTALNAPLSGDVRPQKGITVNGIILRGSKRAIQGNSTEIELNFDAYCAAID